jgi:hypothetical protein
MKIAVRNRELLDRLIESVRDESKAWDYEDYDHCFCGHANALTGNSIGGIKEILAFNGKATEDAETALVMTRFEYRDRAVAVAALVSIRDTGEF